MEASLASKRSSGSEIGSPGGNMSTIESINRTVLFIEERYLYSAAGSGASRW